jgi:hypothetical protein
MPTIAKSSSVQDFARIAQNIEASVLGRLMYGQRELFHSNLLAWFFELPALEGAADRVFRPLTRPGEGEKRKAYRELQHLDLVFKWPDCAPLVLENKVFAIPRQTQLEEYALTVAAWPGSPAALVVLSTGKPSFEVPGWRYLSYEELANSIEQSLPASASYEVETMRRYAALARDLHNLAVAIDVRSDDESVWLSADALQSVDSSQMRAALSKARADRVAQVLNQSIGGNRQGAKGDFSNSTPFVELLEDVKVDGMRVRLGWQLQGEQFRRVVVYLDPSHRTVEQCEKASRAHPEFFTFPEQMPQDHAGRKEFNHFGAMFVYRYVKTPNLTIAELKSAAQRIQDDVQRLGAS